MYRVILGSFVGITYKFYFRGKNSRAFDDESKPSLSEKIYQVAKLGLFLDYDLATMMNIVFSSLTKDCSGFRLPKVARQRQDGRPTQMQSWRFTAYVKELMKQFLENY